MIGIVFGVENFLGGEGSSSDSKVAFVESAVVVLRLVIIVIIVIIIIIINSLFIIGKNTKNLQLYR